MPGTYKVSLSLVAKCETKDIVTSVRFICKPLGLATFPATDLKAKYGWISDASEFSRTMYGTMSYTTELSDKVNAVMQAIIQTPDASAEMMKEAQRIKKELDDILFTFNGPEAKASSEEIPPIDMPLSDRLSEMASASYGTTGDITTIAKEQLEILKVEFPPVLERVKKAGQDLHNLDMQLDSAKAPWTPGRVPLL
jgi:hypothetical protein